MTRHAILAKPHWQPHAASITLLSMPLNELSAFDCLVEFMRDHGRAALSNSDCHVWARLNGGVATLESAIAAMIKTDGPAAPQLEPLRAAYSTMSACASFAGISREPRRAYARTISVAPEELPADWQQHLARIRDRRDDGMIDLVPALFERMTQKLCQFAWFLRESAMPPDFGIAALQAFYNYETTRISIRGARLRPATISATFSDLRDFLIYSKSYPKYLVKELNKLLRKLRDRAEVETSRKFAALAEIDITMICPRADEILASLVTQSNPAKRHIQRNRAMAIAVPPLTPLRREWHNLRYGRDLVWVDGRYRLRDYKLQKPRHRIGRETYPGSVHPSVQHFVDKSLLQDDDPSYLDALRAQAEKDQWPLFGHPDGSEVSENYVSQVWSCEFGTGAHICRSIVYDIVFALSEDATLGGMVLNDHTSHQARKKYTGDQAKFAALLAAGKELDDIFDAYGVGP